jgi:hypothetical protein
MGKWLTGEKWKCSDEEIPMDEVLFKENDREQCNLGYLFFIPFFWENPLIFNPGS